MSGPVNPKVRQAIEQRKEVSLRGFVEAFRFLINVTYNKNTRDEDFAWYKNAYSVVARTNPIDIIQRGGPPLWDLREHIKDGNIRFFLEGNFDDVFAKHRDKGVPDEMDHEKQLITKLRVVWHLFSEAEREQLRMKFLDAISHFAEYVKAVQEEKAL